MPDIDPKSIPVLDDIIENDTSRQHVPAADETTADQTSADQTTAVDADDLFSPASLIEQERSQADGDIDHAANLAALDGSEIARDHDQADTAARYTDADTQADARPVPDTTDHSDAITALDESTPPGDEQEHERKGDQLESDDFVDHVVSETVVDSEPPSETGTAQTSSPQQPGINTTAVTDQIIERIMPEIEQRLRVIIDLTLRENLRDKQPEE